MPFLYFLCCFSIGFGFLLIGSIYIISYLNLLTIGYNFIEYVKYISVRPECLITLLGIIIIYISITMFGGHKNELYL